MNLPRFINIDDVETDILIYAFKNIDITMFNELIKRIHPDIDYTNLLDFMLTIELENRLIKYSNIETLINVNVDLDWFCNYVNIDVSYAEILLRYIITFLNNNNLITDVNIDYLDNIIIDKGYEFNKLISIECCFKSTSNLVITTLTFVK